MRWYIGGGGFQKICYTNRENRRRQSLHGGDGVLAGATLLGLLAAFVVWLYQLADPVQRQPSEHF
ncbi:MAG: hypothetical protein U0401_06395 [Anaerolineae bacterium]